MPRRRRGSDTSPARCTGRRAGAAAAPAGGRCPDRHRSAIRGDGRCLVAQAEAIQRRGVGAGLLPALRLAVARGKQARPRQAWPASGGVIEMIEAAERLGGGRAIHDCLTGRGGSGFRGRFARPAYCAAAIAAALPAATDGEQVALRFVAAFVAQESPLAGGFHAFGDHMQAKGSCPAQSRRGRWRRRSDR